MTGVVSGFLSEYLPRRSRKEHIQITCSANQLAAIDRCSVYIGDDWSLLRKLSQDDLVTPDVSAHSVLLEIFTAEWAGVARQHSRCCVGQLVDLAEMT